MVESKAKEVGATLMAEGLRVEGDASAAAEDIKAFAEEVAAQV